MQKPAWERPVASLLALSKAAGVRTRLLFAGRGSENAFSLQMRGFYKHRSPKTATFSDKVMQQSDISCMRVSLNAT